jgi:hypothetical protein
VSRWRGSYPDERRSARILSLAIVGRRKIRDTPHVAVGPRLRRAPPAHAGYAGFVQPLRTRLSEATIIAITTSHSRIWLKSESKSLQRQ